MRKRKIRIDLYDPANIQNVKVNPGNTTKTDTHVSMSAVASSTEIQSVMVVMSKDRQHGIQVTENGRSLRRSEKTLQKVQSVLEGIEGNRDAEAIYSHFLNTSETAELRIKIE